MGINITVICEGVNYFKIKMYLKKKNYKSKMICSLVLLLGSTSHLLAESLRPLPPDDEWKGTNFNTAYSASVSSLKPFDPSIHEEITPSGFRCSEQLNAAIYRQDILHAFESYAHFDNCAFSDTYEYIQSLVKRSDDHFQSTRNGWGDGNKIPQSIMDGMLNLGQILHAVQDFYAHSNYVELVQEIQPIPEREQNIPILSIWTKEGFNQLLHLINQGLISGRVWWTFPHKCTEGGATHAELAKDTATSPAGVSSSIWKRAVGNKKQNNYNVAYNLAHRGTREFLQWSGERWPQIEKFCGKTLKYITVKDRRLANLPEISQ